MVLRSLLLVVAAGLLASAAEAWAFVQVTDPEPDRHLVGSWVSTSHYPYWAAVPDWEPIDLDADGNADVSIEDTFQDGPMVSFVSLRDAYALSDNKLSTKLSADSLVGSQTSWLNAIYINNYWTGTDLTGEGYMGVRLSKPDGLHYGWVYMDFTHMYIHAWAWETQPNVPILTPEPSCLGLFALGALALKRRRKRQ